MKVEHRVAADLPSDLLTCDRWRSVSVARRAATLALLLVGLCVVPNNCAVAQPQETRLDATAISGEPWGVASVRLPLDEADRRLWAHESFQIVDEGGRVFYPTFSQGTVRRFLAEVLGRGENNNAKQVEVFFLFRGNEPFEFLVETTQRFRVRVRPAPARRLATDRLWQSWWREFVAASRLQEEQSDYPPAIETYLVSLMAQRLRFEMPLLSRTRANSNDELQEALELLMGVEDLRYRLMQETIVQGAAQEQLDQPLPADIAWGPEHRVDLSDDPIPMEALAQHVPAECLYVRFGSWGNQLWLKSFLKSYGEDLSRLISVRGYDARLDDRMQAQIGIVESKVSDLLGGNLVADVGLIGFDTFLREGAAMGILLEQRNGLLSTSINQQRNQLLKQFSEQGGTLETVTIAGREVSFLSTPDNLLRSFYAVDDKFHLLTNSQRLVERFFEAGAGEGSLAKAPEFRYARREFPLDRNDTVFVYLSSRLFRNLLSPSYQIELRRRLQSVTDIELVHMAKLLAKAEGVPGQTLEDWIAAGLLPESFGRRSDGSGVVIVGEEVFDSLRGRRGYFLPIADVAIDRVSIEEAQQYAERAAYFAQRWQRTDPLIVALRKEETDAGTRLNIEARLAPFGEEKYGWLFSILGPPMDSIVQGEDGDVVCMQASVKGGLLLPGMPAHRLFFTLQNQPPTSDGSPDNLLEWLQVIRTAPGYLGASPKPGFLDLLPIGLGAQPDEEGFTKSLLGVWRWQGADVSLLSFDQGRLREAVSDLHYEPLSEPAHIYLKLGQVGTSELRPWVEQMVYLRAKQTTVGNIRLLGQISRQLKVPVDEARSEVERLLDVTLRCAMDGEYELVAPPGLSPRWRSTHLSPLDIESAVRPQVRLLDWLDSAELALRKDVDRVALWGHLVIREGGPETELSNRTGSENE